MKIRELLAETSRPNKSFENDKIVKYSRSTLVYHTTSENAAKNILKDGFKTGRLLWIAEKRGAVYFSDYDVNYGLYARNEEGDTYHGQSLGMVAVDISGIPLLNLSYRENGNFVFYDQYGVYVTHGDLDKIPEFQHEKVAGAISYLQDGKIYEVCLPVDIANRLLKKTIQPVIPEIPNIN